MDIRVVAMEKQTPLHDESFWEGRYLNLMRSCIFDGVHRPNERTRTGCLSLFGRQLRIDLEAEFPVVTTRAIHWRSVVGELLWFLRGQTNVKDLQAMGVTIWDDWAEGETGDLGPIYGKQWRRWSGQRTIPSGGHGDRTDYFTVDQIKAVIRELRTNPDTRRAVVSAWNVAELPEMAIVPCHFAFQFSIVRERLCCQVYQRSADVFLGLPYNVASYALLTEIIAAELGRPVGDLIFSLGDVHLYTNHFEAALTQLQRFPRGAPKLAYLGETDCMDLTLIEKFGKVEDFVLSRYEPWPHIKVDVAR